MSESVNRGTNSWDFRNKNVHLHPTREGTPQIYGAHVSVGIWAADFGPRRNLI